MGFRRYLAPNAREALEKIRKELGPEAVILSNRRAGANRVEIIAAAPGEMRALVEEIAPTVATGAGLRERSTTPRVGLQERRTATVKMPGSPARRAPPESFQEFIRRQATVTSPRLEGTAQREPIDSTEDTNALGESATPSVAQIPENSPPAVFHRRPSRLAGEAVAAQSARAETVRVKAPVPGATAVLAKPTPELPEVVPAALALPVAAAALAKFAPEAPDPVVMAELQTMRSLLSDRITSLEARIASTAASVNPPAPAAGRLISKRQAMTRLLMSGFSPELARRVAEAVPATLGTKDTEDWLHQVIAQQITCPEEKDNPVHNSGAIALVGPTGVGKTTTMAKIAARFVVRHGAAALGLINLDSYRIGAQEQLRGYARILGVPVQTAHDAASLRDLLASMQGKRQVLIDTCGLSQRDPRLAEMLAMLEEARFADRAVERVLLINAASHAETLDEVARAWRIGARSGVIMTKIDEAARIGGALDTMTRYKTRLLGLTNGQRVPEDWHAGNPQLLAHIALKPFGAAFCLESQEAQALTSTGAMIG